MEGLNDLVEEQLLSMSNHLIKMARYVLLLKSGIDFGLN